MKLGTSKITLIKNRTTGEYWYHIDGIANWSKADFLDADELYNTFKSKTSSEEYKNHLAQKFIEKYANSENISNTSSNSVEEEKVEKDVLKLTETVTNLMNFFVEFEFEPSFRFLNTFNYACNKSNKEAKNYILNYFNLINSPYVNALKEKMKSPEFIQILDTLQSNVPSRTVNSRLKIYYGEAGTGKTTTAMKEASKTIPCHSGMLPADIMEDFGFNDGKADFAKSDFWKAMENGEIIVLDEMNLLPFETLRFLQNILDNKQTIDYKGHTININSNFKVIGTMNLVVNGCTYSLPEPLVDRCSVIKEFKLTADNLVTAIL